MLERSDWRLRSSDPKSLAGWVFCTDEGAIVRNNLIGSTCFLIICGLAIKSNISWTFWWFVFLAACVFQYRPKKGPSLSKNSAAVDLVTRLPDIATHHVELEYRREGFVVGRDQGMAAIFDGWLQLEGLRTRFSIREVDAAAVKKLRNGRGVEIAHGEGTVRLIPFSEGGPAKADLFFAAVDDWRFRVRPAAGLPMYPTIVPHPLAVFEPVRRLVVGVALTAIVVTQIASAITFLFGDIGVFLLAVIVFGLPLALGLSEIARGVLHINALRRWRVRP